MLRKNQRSAKKCFFTETLSEHLLSNRPFPLSKYNSCPDFHYLVSSPKYLEVIHTFSAEKFAFLNSLMASLISDLPSISVPLVHIITSSEYTYNKSSNVVIYKVYSLKEAIYALLSISEGKVVILDDINMFELGNTKERKLREKLWGIKHSLVSKKTQYNMTNKLTEVLNSFLMELNMSIVEFKVDHFYKENALSIRNGKFYLTKEYNDLFRCQNLKVKMTGLYILNQTYHDTIKAMLENEELKNLNLSQTHISFLRYTNHGPMPLAFGVADLKKEKFYVNPLIPLTNVEIVN